MSQLEPGTRIGDRYRIVGPLGAGGMGVVYRARDEKLGRQVAVKTLPPERIGDVKARARLVREAKSAAALEHPGIAQIYDVGESEDGGAYLVMELVRGETLRALLHRRAIEQDALLEVIAQVAAALDHAHAQGVIHRDVKPDNVMVREDGRAALLDFGLAKDVGSAAAIADTVSPDTPTSEPEHLTKEGALIGTLSYLAPEQARGRDVGPRSDQFALATTAYEALAHRLPWDGQNVAAVLAQILVDDAPPPSSLESTLPLEVDRVFARALAKDPEDRFDNAVAFANALRRACAGDEEPHAPSRPSKPSAASAPDGTVPEARPLTIEDAPESTARGLRWIAVGASAVTLALVGSLLWPRAPAVVEPALTEASVIGCPVVEASGVEEPTGWLGAMVADLACRRLTWHLGGDDAHTRVPAELLDLPRVADDEFPADPYGEPDARARTLAAAGELDAWIDGSVELTEEGVRVALRLEDGGAAPLATGTGEGEALFIAVAQAVDALVASGALPTTETLDEAIAPYAGTSSVEVVLQFSELGDASLAGVGVETRCRALMARGEALGAMRSEVARMCARWSVEGASDIEPAPLDRSSAATLALTAIEHVESLGLEEVREIAAELEAARREESLPFARAALARSEMQLWQQLGENDRARDLGLTAARDLPRDWFIRVHHVRSMLRTSGAFAATRALAAWHPGKAEAWRTLALPLQRDTERALPLMRRAYESGGTLPLQGIFLGDTLMRDDRREEVRTIAARYATGGSTTRLAGEYLRARVEISQAELGRAFDRLLAGLLSAPSFGRLVNGDVTALAWLLDLAAVLEREHEAADPLVSHFILAEPSRLVLDQPHYEMPAIALCLHATPELGRRCAARLRELRVTRTARAGRIDGADELLSGTERYLEEDFVGAAAAWRPLLRQGSSFLLPVVFERAGEAALAERLERAELRRPGFAGARLVHAREARRAAARGDTARARELAEQVVRAWGAADVPVPAVADMRALLTELPAAPEP